MATSSDEIVESSSENEKRQFSLSMMVDMIENRRLYRKMDEESWTLLCQDMLRSVANLTTNTIDLDFDRLRDTCVKSTSLRFINEYAACILLLYLAEIFPQCYTESLYELYLKTLLRSNSSEKKISKIVQTSKLWLRSVFVRQSHTFWHTISKLTHNKCSHDMEPIHDLKSYLISLDPTISPTPPTPSPPTQTPSHHHKRMKMDTDIPNTKCADWLFLSFQYLHSHELGRSSVVSKTWRYVAMNDILWKDLFRWPIHDDKSSMSWYDKYVRRNNSETRLNSQRIRCFGSKRPRKSRKRICPYSSCFKILSCPASLKRHIKVKHTKKECHT